MWGAGFRDGTRTRINVNSDTQSVSRALFSERDMVSEVLCSNSRAFKGSTTVAA